MIEPPTRTASPQRELEPAERHPDAPESGTVLPSHYENCVACGPAHPTGLRLVTTAGPGVSVTAEFTVTKEHQGAPGLAHGGVLATALDETLGGLSWLLRRPMVTGRLETDYIRPVPVGAVLLLRALCLGFDGRRMYANATARLGDADGSIALRANAVFVVVPPEHFVEHGTDMTAENVHDYEVNP
ncbi:PaaI family thioesterase [Kribbella qitaiheensis]|uniref:PaaI family thioesterase n=1 Tax=Kribbella qitaiheensis TaxID=1544730 RepID=UPI00162AD00A|nr:PaaI family thioesterase [Kribbella qitaiheensis]